MMIRKARIISLVVLLLSFSSCSPSAPNDSENISESSFSSESSTSSEGEHPVKDINFNIIPINIKRGDYAWYRFENRGKSQALGVLVFDSEPICLEPYHEQIPGFSPESRNEIALVGAVNEGADRYYYAFYDFYLHHGEDIYFRISPKEARHVNEARLVCGELEALKELYTDSEDNHYLSDLHVHELTFYSYDPVDHDHNPRFGHYHICWKRDLSVFEEHEFGSPYTGSDGKTYVSCLKCQFIQEVLFKDSSSDN